MEPLRDKYVENTRAALLSVGRAQFASRAYADISTDDLVQPAGLTRGALYHHFNGKRGLFEAVFSELEDEAAQYVTASMAGTTDPLERAARGARAYLVHCADDEFRHVVLQQGPIALGWQRTIEIDIRYVGGILNETVQAAVDAGLIMPFPVDLITSAFFGVLTNLALTIAAAEDPEATRESSIALVDSLLAGLRAGSAS